jgi:uncharacterized protein YkwD
VKQDVDKRRRLLVTRRGLVIAAGAVAVILAISFLARLLERDESAETTATREIIELTNTVRNASGLESLEEDGSLERSARDYAAYLAKGGEFDHVDAEGRGPTERAEAAGYNDGNPVLENLASGEGRPDARTVITSWLSSQPHHDNLVAAEATEMGVACASDSGGFVCVQEFGTRAVPR